MCERDIDRALTPQCQWDADQTLFGYYAVAFLDPLGQTEVLNKLDELYDPPNIGEEFIGVAKKTFGTIMWLRETARSTFGEFQEVWPTFIDRSSLTPDQEAALEEFKAAPVEVDQCGDAIACHTRLASSQGVLTVHGVYALIMTAGSMLTAALAGRQPIRGAVEIGVSAKLPDGDLYGAALSRAHYLESKEAINPRILVGPNLMDYLNWVIHAEDDDLIMRLNKALTKQIKSVIFVDKDGRRVVDHLGKAFAQFAKDDRHRSVFLAADAFVKEQFEKFNTGEAEGLCAKYAYLKSYFDSRRQYWV